MSVKPEGQEPEADKQTDGEATPPTSQGGNPPSEDTGEDFEPQMSGDSIPADIYREHLAKLRQSDKSLRERLRENERALASVKDKLAELDDAKVKLKEFEEAKLTEAELAAKRAEEQSARMAELEWQADQAQQEKRRLTVEHAVAMSAARLGAADPLDLVRLIEARSVEFDDDGHPANVDALVEEVLNAKPYLRRGDAAPTPTGQVPNAAKPRNGETLTESDLRSMTPDEINRRFRENDPAFLAALKGGS